MRENLTETEMRGSLHIDFSIKRLNQDDAAQLCATLCTQVRGVQTVSRISEPNSRNFDTFRVTVDNSRLQYFFDIHEDVLRTAHRFQCIVA